MTKVTTEKTWYDLPHYYDLGFREETKQESTFLENVFQKFAKCKVKRIFEPGCGTGRLVLEMAARGYEVTGFDLNRNMLDYCRKRMVRRKLDATLLEGDMEHFRLGKRFHAAFNAVNTFRHLLTEDAAESHLRCVFEHLIQGGLYVLGLHLLPVDADPMDQERWQHKSKSLKINYFLRVTKSDLRKRIERLRLTMTVHRNGTSFKIADEFDLRIYRAQQLRDLLKKVPEFELCEVYDFWYEIDEPQKFDNYLSDAVFVLRKL